jgi:hypothetical protein
MMKMLVVTALVTPSNQDSNVSDCKVNRGGGGGWWYRAKKHLNFIIKE